MGGRRQWRASNDAPAPSATTPSPTTNPTTPSSAATTANANEAAKQPATTAAGTPRKRAASVSAWLSKQRPGEVKARRHGLTYDAYQELLDAAGHACTICGSTKDLRIDHDHACCPDYSKGCCVRGILCHRCNITLGAFGDSLDHLAAALRYLLGERGARLVDGGIDALRGWLT